MPKTLRAGELRHPIVIQTPTTTPNGSGGYTTAWAALATVWAKRTQMPGAGDTAEADQTVSRRRYEYLVRRRSDVSAQMRVVDGAVTSGITAVRDDDERPDALVLECLEVTT